MKILVVEDDPYVVEVLKLLLSSYNYAVDVATDGEAGQQMASAFKYDLVILDLLLPKMDGVTLCQKLRAYQQPMPILLLTGQDEQRQKVEALNAGADDYVVKPFDADELMARVQALLRRYTGLAQPQLQWGDLQLDPSSQRVTYGAQPLTLTPKEYAILELLLRNRQRILSAQLILDHVWSSVECPGEETVRFHIKALRKKLKDSGAPPNFIKTVYGVGYGLNQALTNVAPAATKIEPANQQRLAELISVNQELRTMLEDLQTTRNDLERQVVSNQSAIQHLQGTLQQQQRQWQTVFKHALEGIILADDTSRPLEANSAACQLIGSPLAQLTQTPLTQLIQPQDEFSQAWEMMLAQGKLKGKFTLLRPNGEPHAVQIVASTTGQPQQHLVLVFDAVA